MAWVSNYIDRHLQDEDVIIDPSANPRYTTLGTYHVTDSQKPGIGLSDIKVDPHSG